MSLAFENFSCTDVYVLKEKDGQRGLFEDEFD